MFHLLPSNSVFGGFFWNECGLGGFCGPLPTAAAMPNQLCPPPSLERLTTSRHESPSPEPRVLVRHLALFNLLQASRDSFTLVERREDASHVACCGLESGCCCGSCRSWGEGCGGRRRGRRGRSGRGRDGRGGIGGRIDSLRDCVREGSSPRREKETHLGVPDESGGVVSENVLAQVLEEYDERASPFDLLRIPAPASSQLKLNGRNRSPARLLAVLDDSIGVELRAILHVSDVRSWFAVLSHNRISSPIPHHHRSKRRLTSVTHPSAGIPSLTVLSW